MIRWTTNMQRKLEIIFAESGCDWAEHVGRRITAYMTELDTGSCSQTPIPEAVFGKSTSLIGATREQVMGRVASVVRMRLGLSVAEEKRAERREVLRGYAKAGIRSIAQIEAADAGQTTLPINNKANGVQIMPKLRNPETAKSTAFTVRCDDSIMERLDAYADALGINRADAARAVLSAGLDAKKRNAMNVDVRPYLGTPTGRVVMSFRGDVA